LRNKKNSRRKAANVITSVALKELTRRR